MTAPTSRREAQTAPSPSAAEENTRQADPSAPYVNAPDDQAAERQELGDGDDSGYEPV